eukprot:gene31516-6696_t
MAGFRSLSMLALLLFGNVIGSASAMGEGMVGGPSPENVNDEGVLESANIAVKKVSDNEIAGLLSQMMLVAPLELVEVKSASSQVVAGMLYTLTIRVKDAAWSVADIDVQVWSRPWLARSNDASVKADAFILKSATAHPIE